MSRSRLSIAGLMLMVAVAALGIVALRAATERWAGVVFTVAITVLAASLLAIMYRLGAERAYWAGFALFGWGYMLLTVAPGISSEIRPRLVTSAWIDDFWRLQRTLDMEHPAPGIDPVVASMFRKQPEVAATIDQMVRTKEQITRAMRQAKQPNDPAVARYRAQMAELNGHYDVLWITLQRPLSRMAPTITTPSLGLFQNISHSLISLIAAVGGGLIAKFLYATRGELCPSAES